MKRRRSWSMVWFVVCICSSVSVRADSPSVARRPNIVWISCEDISPHLGCYGDPNAITPNIDQLATEGVRFTHAFTTAGVCAPCRSGIITAMYQTTLGSHHMRSRVQLPAGMRPFPAYLRDAGYYTCNNSKQDYQFKCPEGVWNQSGGRAHWRRRQGADRDKPFFAVFNFTGCHESGIFGRKKYDRVTRELSPEHRRDPAKLTLPPYYPDTPEVREDWKRNYELITAMDRWAGRILKELRDDGLWENTIVFFWSDHGVGLPRAKRWLYDSGTRVPLIVRIPEGCRTEGQGNPHTVSARLVSSIDFGPTVLNLAGVAIPQHVQGQAFLGPNRPEPRRYVFGARDRMDERYDIIRSVRSHRFRYIRNYEPHRTYYQFITYAEQGATMKAIRRGQQRGTLTEAASRYLADHKPVEELYDLQYDPHEIHNLADDPAHQKTLVELRQVHADWMIDSADLGLIPESELFVMERETPVRADILKNRDAVYRRRLRRAAMTATDSSGSLKACLENGSAEDVAIRYWGVVGVSRRELTAETTVWLRDRLGDSAPCIRVAAATALLATKHRPEALERLSAELAGDNEWAALRAAIALDEAGPAAAPVINAIREAAVDQPNKYIVRVVEHALSGMPSAQDK